MKFLRTLLAAGAVALATMTPAQAQSLVFTVEGMSGPAEVPPNDSPGTGSATLTFDLAASTMHVATTFSGLTAGTTVAHVHCCTTLADEGTAPPATTLPSFPGFPTDVTAGSFEGTFDMLDPASYNTTNNPMFAIAATDPQAAFTTFLDGLQAGTAYFNIHTTAFPGGEIRGFLHPVDVAPIPEPGTYALMLAGLGLVGWAASRRRRH